MDAPQGLDKQFHPLTLRPVLLVSLTFPAALQEAVSAAQNWGFTSDSHAPLGLLLSGSLPGLVHQACRPKSGLLTTQIMDLGTVGLALLCIGLPDL